MNTLLLCVLSLPPPLDPSGKEIVLNAIRSLSFPTLDKVATLSVGLNAHLVTLHVAMVLGSPQYYKLNLATFENHIERFTERCGNILWVALAYTLRTLTLVMLAYFI